MLFIAFSTADTLLLMKKVFEFKYYDEKEFTKFLDSLPEKDRVKLTTTISKIEKYGLHIAFVQKWVKKLVNYTDLYEIRSKFSSNITRAIYFKVEKNGDFVVSHAFKKKSQKTPKNEIDKANRRREKY